MQSDLWGALDSAFESALEVYRRTTVPVGVLFSGGLDSSLIAWALRGCENVRLRSIGVPGAGELGRAKRAAELVGLLWSGHSVTPSMVRRTMENRPDLAVRREPSRSVQIALALAIEATEEPLLLCGQGADELFMGYAHHRDADEAVARRRYEIDLRRLDAEDWPQTEQTALSMGCSIVSPYLSIPFRHAAEQIPWQLRRPRSNVSKPIFRRWATHRGLPRELAESRKRALQYSSGIARVVRSLSPESCRTQAIRGSPGCPPLL